MCENHEHKFRLTIKDLDTRVTHRYMVYAKNISQAVARADAWAHANFASQDAGKYGNGPDASAGIEITIHRMGYSDRTMAEAHGADFIFVDMRDAELSRWATEAEQVLLSKYG